MRSVQLVMLAVLVGVVGCEKKKKPVEPVAAAPTQPVAQTPPTKPVDERNTNFKPGAGVVGNVLAAKDRTDLLNNMRNVGQFISIVYNETGKMPDKARILDDLKQAGKALKQVNEGVIILTGTTNYSGLWAYEVDSDQVGGIGLVAGVPQRMSADDIKMWMSKK